MYSLYEIMEQVSDIDLFQRIRRSDRQALNNLFEKYYQPLCRFACSFTIVEELAEEIVSDVFFIIWKNREKLEIHSNVRAYLYRCVRNAALAAIRQVRPEMRLSREHDQPHDATPESEAEFNELNQQLETAIGLLPERCRQIFTMSRFEGMKYKEIANVLGISQKTVEYHMVNALENIRSRVIERLPRDVGHKSVTVS